MKAIWCGILLILFMAVDASAASFEYAARQCKEKMQKNPPNVEIVYSYGSLKLDNTKTTEEIEKIFKQTHQTVEAHKINGLTTLSPYAQLESSIQAEIVNNRVCYYPKDIRIHVGYKPVVYIASDVSKRGCRFILTVRHEQTHLDIGHLSLQLFAQRLKQEFGQILADVGPVIKARAEEVPINQMSEQMNQTYHNRLKILFDDFVQKLLTENARIDTEENYRKESDLCKD
ncbi:MAG: hypothetical protein IJ218_04480 [Alphaproteobacteria bacterium]|nr:hypothetical protein [Alphaproteobacteria bacterium]